MSKQSIFGRIAQLAKANINALIDSAEDPSLMLDQMVRDYTNSIAEAESAIAQTIGNLRLLEQDHAEDIANADDWGRKALAASRKADELPKLRARLKAELGREQEEGAELDLGRLLKERVTASLKARHVDVTIVATALPVIGADSRVPGVFHACGHEGAGIGLAPATGFVVAQQIRQQHGEATHGDVVPFDLTPFDANRFSVTDAGTGGAA